MVGTSAYIAPEVVNRKPYSKECDIWRAGMILHAMLRDQFSFDIDHNKEAVIWILED